MRGIKRISKASKVNMGGIVLDQPLPDREVNSIDPFLLIHHWDDQLPGGQQQKDVGVGPHPHRGFAPVTFIFKGSVHHRDSMGHESVVSQGGTQWMNSGKGLVHSERPSKDLAESGGDFELIQFWVNIPAKNKMDFPEYIPLDSSEMPVLSSDDNIFKVGLVCGSMGGKKGPIAPKSELLILRMDYLKDGGVHDLEIPTNYNALLYNLDGELEVNGERVYEREMVHFENNDELIQLKSISQGRAIILSGEPINEPVATYGPFVMNTQSEIMDAMRDYQSGEMGNLTEKFE